MDTIFVPMYLHIDPHVFAGYPELYKQQTRMMLTQTVAAGFAGNPRIIRKQDG